MTNKPDAMIADLIAQVLALEAKLERAHWRNKNQRREIRNLNKVIVGQYYVVTKWKNEVASTRKMNIETN